MSSTLLSLFFVVHGLSLSQKASAYEMLQAWRIFQRVTHYFNTYQQTNQPSSCDTLWRNVSFWGLAVVGRTESDVTTSRPLRELRPPPPQVLASKTDRGCHYWLTRVPSKPTNHQWTLERFPLPVDPHSKALICALSTEQTSCTGLNRQQWTRIPWGVVTLTPSSTCGMFLADMLPSGNPISISNWCSSWGKSEMQSLTKRSGVDSNHTPPCILAAIGLYPHFCLHARSLAHWC